MQVLEKFEVRERWRKIRFGEFIYFPEVLVRGGSILFRIRNLHAGISSPLFYLNAYHDFNVNLFCFVGMVESSKAATTS